MSNFRKTGKLNGPCRVSTTENTKWIFGIFILEFERTQKPRHLTSCRLRHMDTKIRPHYRAKYGRGGFGISRVTTLTVSRLGFFGEAKFANSPRTQQPLNLRVAVFERMRVRSCRPIFLTIVRSMTVWGQVLVELRLCEWWSFGGQTTRIVRVLSMLFWAFFLDSRRGCWRGLYLAILSRECQDTMCVSVLVAEIRAPGDIRVRFVSSTKKVW